MTKNKKKYSAGAEMRATWEELKAGAVAREKQAGEGPWRFSADGMSTSGNAPSYMGTDPASPEAQAEEDLFGAKDEGAAGEE